MTHVDELCDWEFARSIQAVWRRLHAQTRDADFFQSFAWLETYWRFYGERQQLRILVVREGSQPVGIVPLTLLSESTKLGPLRVLTYPPAYWGSFYGPIGPRPRETLTAALNYLAARRRDWDLLDLRFTPTAESDPAATRNVMQAAGFAPSPKIVDYTSLIELPGSIDEYLNSRGAKWRNNCKRWLRRLREQGDLRYVRYRPTGGDADGDPRWDLYDDCEAVARRSWQGSSTTGTTLTHESIRPFLRAMHETACREGAADVNLLYLNDVPLAFLYCYRCRERMFGLRTGFDETVAKEGVGNIMYLHVLEDSIARGDRLLDLGPGSLKAKEPLQTRIEPIYRLPFANSYSWRGLAWRVKEALGDLQRSTASFDGEDAPDEPEPTDGPQQPTAQTV